LLIFLIMSKKNFSPSPQNCIVVGGVLKRYWFSTKV
jgi:hypothetical protein